MIRFKIAADQSGDSSGCHSFLRRYVTALHRLWTQQRLAVSLAALENEGGCLVLPFPLLGQSEPDAFIVVQLSQIESEGEETTWRLHFRSNPQFLFLALEDRITLADMQRDALALMTQFEGVRHIDSVCPQRA